VNASHRPPSRSQAIGDPPANAEAVANVLQPQVSVERGGALEGQETAAREPRAMPTRDDRTYHEHQTSCKLSRGRTIDAADCGLYRRFRPVSSLVRSSVDTDNKGMVTRGGAAARQKCTGQSHFDSGRRERG
jgi:hypothetical protein